MIYKLSSKLFFVCAFLLCVLQLHAQEVLFPLGANPVIKEYLRSHSYSLTANRMQALDDTITLPFIDDFSQQGIYPDFNLWSDSDAFINNSFCDHPITIGVATLDGIDKFGRPHDSLSGATDTADFLTSRPIHLNFPGETTMWLSFFYQPQGLGDEPEPEDSLTLQFLDSTGQWNWIWSAEGHPDTSFRRVDVHITDSTYLHDGFRFRFMNYATLNGNRDHWNIDYVILNKNRFANDSIRDIALINPQFSLLRNFQAMPYSHYKSMSPADQLSETKTSIADTAFNINYGGSTLNYYSTIADEAGTNLYTSTINIQSTTSNSHTLFTSQLNGFVFPSNSADSASFLVKDFMTQNGNASRPFNDTNYYSQKFYNYYAYDDGSAEWGFGIPELGAKIAYRFDVKMADTLRGVQIYFNPVGDIVHNKLFKLCLWSDVNVTANTDNLIYRMINCKPANIDVINGFATYLFDTLLVVPAGSMYVGWIQNDATLLGIGVDRNLTSTNNMFSFYSGYWHQSQVQGSWMMRPLFGDTLTYAQIIGIDEPVHASFSFDIFPNPASASIHVNVRSENKTTYEYQLFSNHGALMLSGVVSSGKIDLDHLSNGFYFVRITDKQTRESVTKKLVVLHN